MKYGRGTDRSIGRTTDTKTTTVVRIDVRVSKGTTNNSSSKTRGTDSRCRTAAVIDVRVTRRSKKRRSDSRNICHFIIMIQ